METHETTFFDTAPEVRDQLSKDEPHTINILSDDSKTLLSIKTSHTKQPHLIHDEHEFELTNKLVFSNTDSDSDTETIVKRRTSKISKIIDSESDDDIPANINDVTQHSNTSNSSDNHNRESTNRLSKYEDSSESSTKEEEEGYDFSRRKKIKIYKKRTQKNRDNKESINKLQNLCDEDISSEYDDCDEGSITGDNMTSQKTTSTRPPKRMSAKEADEQMKLIQSESQRMARETHLSIPYHRPKQHSLKEFLNRKTINKAVPLCNIKKTAAAIKMSRDELELYAKKLDDRAMESQEFFKSESDNEEQINEPYSSTLVKTLIEAKSSDTSIANNITSLPIIDEEKNAINEIESVDNDKIPSEIKNKDDSFAQTETIITDAKDIETMECNEGEHPENNNESEEKSTHTLETIAIDTNSLEHPHINKNAMENKIDIDYNYDFGKVDDCRKFRKLKESVRCQVADNIPTLKGTSDSVIDLETGDILPKSKSGVDELYERFLKHRTKSVKKDTSDLNVINTANGILEIEKITINLDEDDVIIKDCKPRSAYFKLKEKLGEQIAQNRKKKIMENINLEKEDVTEDELEEIFDHEINELESTDDEKCENKINNDNEIENNISIINDEESVLQSDDDNDNNDAESNSDEDESKSITESIGDDENKTKSRKRIVVLDDSDEEKKIESKEDQLLESQTGSELINENQLNSILLGYESDFLHDISDLCLESENKASTDKNPVTTLFTQTVDDVSESQLLELCSGTFATQLENVVDDDNINSEVLDTEQQNIRLAFESSDEEDAAIQTKTTTNPNKRKIRHLGFSDEEDDDEIKTVIEENYSNDVKITSDTSKDTNEDSMTNNEEKVQQEDDDEERYIDYDSEENEVEVTMKKTDRQKRAAEFFENEADLSESDWGSDDEDEQGLDKMDLELGDEDEFDKGKLKSELERIHMRRVLDQDIREVNIIKEMLFEDEENNGQGRERQFKWKNVNNNLNIDDRTKNNEDDMAGPKESDDENEELWRRMRHERNLLLQEKKPIDEAVLTSNKNDKSSPYIEDDVDLLTLKKKITIMKSSNNTPRFSSTKSPFLITKNGSLFQSPRSSFLSRDEKTLTRLASLTKVCDNDGESGLMPSAAGTTTKNFVFTALSQSIRDKRKSEDSSSIEINQSKKLKLMEPKKNNNRLLDILT